MKNIIFAILIIFTYCNMNAQTPVIDVYSENNGEIQNAYYKDIDNFLNQYVGTWLLTSGTMSLKITFTKKVMFYNCYDTPKYYEDLLVGEYQYIENGVEKVNTLNNLTINTNNPFDYNLLSVTRIPKNKFTSCVECNDTEKRLLMFINEPNRRQYDFPGHYFILRRFIENGINKLKIVFNTKSGEYFYDKATGKPTTLETFSLPFGTYILTKQ